MADFTTPDKFSPDKNFTGVKFGYDSFLLEVELNEAQKIQAESRADMLRKSTHSGFRTMYTTYDTGTTANDSIHVGSINSAMSTFAYNTGGVDGRNRIMLGFDVTPVNKVSSVVQINGYQIVLPRRVDILMPDPPATGTRDDLVFLEAWFEEFDMTETIHKYGGDGQTVLTNDLKDVRVGVETSRRVQLRWRIRTVAGVDFATYSYDGFSNVSGSNVAVLAQGAMASPASGYNFNRADILYSTYGSPYHRDAGLYVAGDGSSAAKSALGTEDGFVYAIPIFRVKRRNTGGFSPNNFNGGRTFYAPYVTMPNTSLVTGQEYTFTVDSVASASIMVGDVIQRSNTDTIKVTSLINSTSFKGIYLATPGYLAPSSSYVMTVACDRPDGLFPNVIDQRDITDLRHYVPMQKPNYDTYLRAEFDKYMRGELTNHDTLKTYHGLRKTTLDANHVFYASLDGTTSAELGGAPLNVATAGLFVPSVTGVGIKNTAMRYAIPTAVDSAVGITVDLFFDPQGSDVFNNDINLFTLWKSVDTTTFVSVGMNSGKFRIKNQQAGTLKSQTAQGTMLNTKMAPGVNHLRFTYQGGTMTVYLNGTQMSSITGMGDIGGIDRVNIGGLDVAASSSNRFLGSYCDFSVSNINRGSTFASLPADFVAGYARIANGFDGQRKILSEAQSTQYVLGVAKIGGAGNSRGVTISNQQNSSVWTAGDTITVKGVAGEFLTGVYDTDTAFATVIRDALVGDTVVYLDDVSKIADGDTIRFFDRTTNTMSADYTIATSGVDSVNKKITLTGALTATLSRFQNFVVEDTATTSTPVVKFMYGTTPTVITGAWSALGTNAAVFTLGSLPTGLASQDIQIEYSLTMPAGQGGLPEVLSKTYGGEANGGSLVAGSLALRDDFLAKTVGDTTGNPNVMKTAIGAALSAPTGGTEVTGYANVSTLDGTVISTEVNANGSIPQQVFQFDLIRMVESKYGTIPAADKVAWLKANVYKIDFIWYGYGARSNGTNNMYLSMWRTDMSAWSTTTLSTQASTPTLLDLSVLESNNTNKVSRAIDTSGMVTFSVYGDASDGTANAGVYTDYAKIELQFNSVSGYDQLVPSNPRRDAGRSAVLFIRKETKEVQTFLNADSSLGLVTYGEFIPAAPLLLTTENVMIVSEMSDILVTDLGVSVGYKQGTHHWMNPTYRVRGDNLALYGEFGFGSAPLSADSRNVNTGATVQINQYGFSNNFTVQYAIPVIQKPLVAISRWLVVHNNELKLLVISQYTTNGSYSTAVSTTATALLIPITGRPLVREVDGVVRSGILTSTAWKTQSERIEGYMNAQGQIVATYL